MATRHPAPQAARRPSRRISRAQCDPRKILYSRTLQYEPLEDRRLLALVTVNTPLDTVDLEDDLTSLREAIFATNLVSGPDEITFDFGHDGPETILLTQGELRITDNLTIDGPGANLLTIDASASDPTPGENSGDGSRVFNVDNGDPQLFINVTIRGLTLTGGDVLAGGGAIRSREHFTLRDSVVSGSAAVSADPLILSYGGGIAHSDGLLAITGSIITENFGDFGGGIHVDGGQAFLASTSITANVGRSGAGIYNDGGVAFISRSTIRDNSAGAFSLGGGIYSSGNLSVFDTTISGNSADYGGGVFSRTETVGDNETLIVNSTISGNTAFSRGGGVRNAYGRTTIQFSTITGNTAPPGEGSGVASRGYTSATTRVSHTIIAGNTNSDVDFGTGTVNTFVSRGYNLIGTGNAAAAFQGPGDQTGVANPLLGPLADNGGFILPDGSRILTHALLPGSPAINRGDLNAKAGEGGIPTYDQRLEPFSRVVNGRIDVGAFEYQEPSDLNLVVDTLDDESDGNHGRNDLSLREAIELANLYPSDDTIRFDPALTAAGPAIILLTKGELAITDDISIVGPGATLLTIDASGNDPTPDIDDGAGSRVFYVSKSNVSIIGLKITGGDTEFGGAILSHGQLTVAESVITGNSTTGNGGGIYRRSGSVRVENSTISDNSAYIGAGINHSNFFGDSGSLTIIGSTISDNRARGSGGGVSAGNGNHTITDSTISGNSAGFRGGGISNTGGLIVTRSVVTNNAAGRFGGGIHHGEASGGNGDLKVVNSTISENLSRESGGGVHIYRANITVTESSVSGNSATKDGGGIYSFITDVSVTGSTISDNGAEGRGGAVYHNSRPLTLTNSTISGNSAGTDGGGIYARYGIVTVAESAISDNTAGGDGGAIRDRATTLSVTNSAIERNTAGRNGGAVRTEFLTLTGSTVSGNSAAGSGGGIYGLSTLTVASSTISGNSARVSGGGVFNPFGRIAVMNSAISDNTAVQSGGGIFSSGELSTFHTTIRGNSSAGAGGGISTDRSRTNVSLNDTTISDNSATLGAGIYNRDATLTLTDVTISGNAATGNGGGILNRRGNVAITNSTISGNTADGSGAGLYSIGTGPAAFTVRHSTIVLNSARGVGGGIFYIGATLLLDHSIVATNSALVGPDLSDPSARMAEIRYSLIGSNSSNGLTEAPVGSPDANGNLIGGAANGMINPLLGPLANNGGPTLTHALLPGSPAINAGDPAAMAGVGGVPQFDQRCAPFIRVYGGRIDIGAFESQPNPLPGDYNFNGVVDTADVIIWRKTLFRSNDLRADGNGDDVVNQADWQVWRENFGRTAESGEQGAAEAPMQRPAWQPAASPGVSLATSRAAFRPVAQRFAPQDDLLAALASPRAVSYGRNDFVPARRWGDWGNAPEALRFAGAMPQAPARDVDSGLAYASIGVVDRVFETLGADVAGTLRVP